MGLNSKTLKFADPLVELILSGEKTVTWRLFDDKDLQVADMVELLTNAKEKFGEAEILSVKEKKLGEIGEADFAGHEIFANRDDMLNTYKGYYGDRVTWDTVVKIIAFRLNK